MNRVCPGNRIVDRGQLADGQWCNIYWSTKEQHYVRANYPVPAIQLTVEYDHQELAWLVWHNNYSAPIAEWFDLVAVFYCIERSNGTN